MAAMACSRVSSLPAIASSVPRCSSLHTSASSQHTPIATRHLLQPSSTVSTNPALRKTIEIRRPRTRRHALDASTPNEGVPLPDLQVPREWVSPAIAAQEAEWLSGALREWLDDEFCPEPANEEISRRCARVYYYCLLEEQLDVGDILMQMVRDLETFSFKQSFHGAFSSANAAIDLITRRMRAREPSSN